MKYSELTSLYRRFRGGWMFLAVLVLTIAGWLLLHWTIGLDPELTKLNLVLSIEASVSIGLLIAAQGKDDTKQDEREERILADVEDIERRLSLPRSAGEAAVYLSREELEMLRRLMPPSETMRYLPHVFELMERLETAYRGLTE